ncbi:PREDICTED: T-cell immunoglobulin and mucin domain-containing protein 4 [Condylura cristata]|uniref:T-cell immunoglobulin and mucin domain-containing protein 4 n=1 Tax=Condylura cristata TaxID=143302 RepID=UPI00064329E7|nr:PREDICTED: T-cell immunoglobulin and mucin domain-containing protein 4 [Condylura cristata]
MSKAPLVLWLAIELGRLYLTSAVSETVVKAYWGQTVTLPCMYPSWSQNRNSMCWGKGQCPKSRCNEELISTDGSSVVSRKSSKYTLSGNIPTGKLFLEISDVSPSDSGVYCCRIEVPGWFNDVKKNIHLQLLGAPPSTRRTTTTTVSTTTARTTTARTTTARTTTARTTLAGTHVATRVFPTMSIATLDLTTQTPLQTTTAALTTATICPSTTPSAPSEVTSALLPTQPSPEGPMFTGASKDWVLKSTSQASIWETRNSMTFPQPRASETATLIQHEHESKQIRMADNSDLLMIIVTSLGFLLLALLVGFFLRGKILKTGCFRKHSRLESLGKTQNSLSDMQQGREDEDGLFTL